MVKRNREKAKKHLRVLAALQIAQQRPELSWLDLNLDAMSGIFKAYPEMDELPTEFAVNLVVELYSKC